MIRRLAASLLVLVCLFGAVQPALACVSPSDCCPAGCSGLTQPAADWIGMSDCCALQAPIGASVSLAPQTRHALNVAGGSPAFTAPAGPLQLVATREIGAARAETASRTNQSLTYLRTARLRL